MSMSNYLCPATVLGSTMAMTQPSVGVDHPTVVPENYDVEDDTVATVEKKAKEL